MKARLRVSFIVILSLVLTLSCARPPFNLLGIHTGVNLVTHVDREGYVSSSYESLSVFVESEDDANLQMEVISPDTLNTWIFPALKQSVDKQGYYGKAGLTLGSHAPLPRGEWSVRVLKSDGRTITEHFTLEKGSATASYENHLDAEKKELILDVKIGECALQLLDETNKVLYRSTTTEQAIDLSTLYPKWDRVRSVGLSWYDEASRQSHIVWYDL